MKVAEYQLLLCYQKPLKDMSLKEVVDGVIITSRAGNWLESIEYMDDGNYYTIIATHNAKDTNVSKMFEIFFGTLFESYGVKTESTATEHSLFMKIFKDISRPSPLRSINTPYFRYLCKYWSCASSIETFIIL